MFILFRKTAAAPYKSVSTPNPENIQYNPEVPCVRSNIKLEYKEDRGRMLVANEDIKPGLYMSKKKMKPYFLKDSTMVARH